MAASEGGIGFGSTVEVETSTGVWFELGEVGDIPFPDESVDEVDLTHQKSPGGAYEEGPGLVKYGEMQLPLNWVPGNPTETYILTWRGLRQRRNVRITAPNGKAYMGLMFPKALSRVLPVKEKMAATVTLKAAGAFSPIN